LAAVGGDLRRMPIVGGTEHGDKAIRETVTSGLEAMIEKHRLNVASFDQETLNNTFDRAAARIRETEFKIQCYREFLGAQAERLDAELAEARRLLREKVEALAAVESTETAA
jgi:hypothetical protein